VSLVHVRFGRVWLSVRYEVRAYQILVIMFLLRSDMPSNLPWLENGVRMRRVKERRHRCPSRLSGLLVTARRLTKKIKQKKYIRIFKKLQFL